MTSTPLCPTHHTPLVCPRCTGAKGGSATSPAKAQAARDNGKKHVAKPKEA